MQEGAALKRSTVPFDNDEMRPHDLVHSTTANTAVSTTSATPFTGNVPSCPNCASLAVQNVRALVEGSTNTAQGEVVTRGFALEQDGSIAPMMMRSSTSAHTSSLLAQRLAAPPEPIPSRDAVERAYSAVTTVVGAFAVAWVLLFFLTRHAGPGSSDIIAIYHWVTGGAVVSTLALVAWTPSIRSRSRRRKQEFDHSMTVWSRSSSRWANLSYCSGCDHVADPRTGEAVPSDRLAELLAPKTRARDVHSRG